MLVIDKNKTVHHITSNSANSIYYENLDDIFKGSYNIHNHPPNETQFTFSVDADIPAMFFDGTKVMEAFDYKYCYRFELPNGITFEEWNDAFSYVEDNKSKLFMEKGLKLEEYEENYLHILIEETCKQLGIKGYYRWKR